jgi:hypothetical protein
MAFAVAFFVVTSSGGLSVTALCGFAVFQLGFVGWRLWVAGRRPWFALVPPLSTAALWFLLGRLAVAEDAKVGGDGGGLIAAMTSMAWCVIIYVAAAIWAGAHPTASRVAKSR